MDKEKELPDGFRVSRYTFDREFKKVE